MRILITGSRSWVDPSVIHRSIWSALKKDVSQVTVVHGGALGADYQASMFAKRMGISEEVHKAKWEEYGKRAGYIRNKEMVDSGADICLAFIRNNSRGATMCLELAESANIPTKVWRVND